MESVAIDIDCFVFIEIVVRGGSIYFPQAVHGGSLACQTYTLPSTDRFQYLHGDVRSGIFGWLCLSEWNAMTS